MLSALEVRDSLGSLLLSEAGAPDARFRCVVVDSRQAGRGDLFVALPGERHDGHAFVADAVARGARGVLVRERPAGLGPDTAVFVVPDTLAALQRLAAGRRERRRAKVAGITGSVGKTTTKEIVAAPVFSKLAPEILAYLGVRPDAALVEAGR